MTWIDYDKQKPEKVGSYLTRRINDDGHGETWYEVSEFSTFHTRKEIWSKEFNQLVFIKIKNTEPEFKEDFSIVLSWMEIPEDD